MAHNDRRDENENEIREAFRAAGWFWQPCDRYQGHDANVYGSGMCFAVEVKNGYHPPSHRTLTPLEKQFKRTIELRGVRLWILLSVDDALALISGNYEAIPELPEYATLPIEDSDNDAVRLP